MLGKILSFFLLILIFSISSCEDYYSFEAKKLEKKATKLVEESYNSALSVDERIIVVSQALEKLNKLQKKYPKTKVARELRKNEKIDNLSNLLESLKTQSNVEKIEEEKKDVSNFIKEKTYTAAIELKRRDFIKSSLLILDAAEKSITEISDPRSKARLLNKISEARFNVGDKKGSLNTIMNSLEYVNQMHVDLPKKILHLSKIYEIFYLLDEEDKYKNVEKKIYSIINNDITFDDNKSVALTEIAKVNQELKNINQVNNDIKKALGLANSSAAYLAISSIQYDMGDPEECKKTLLLAKKNAIQTNQEFWIVRELIKIAEFENSIKQENESNKTLMEAKKYVLKNSDDRIFVELIGAFAKINNLEEAKELLNLMKPGYEKAMAMSLIGLANKNDSSIMEYFLNEALKTVPDLIGGQYSLGLPGFSTKARVYMTVAKSYAHVGNFEKAYKLLGLIESDRFYKEGIHKIIYLQSKVNKEDAKIKILEILNFGGKILDNKLISELATVQSISGDIENSFKTINLVVPSVDLSESLINIAIHISLQQEDPST